MGNTLIEHIACITIMLGKTENVQASIRDTWQSACVSSVTMLASKKWWMDDSLHFLQSMYCCSHLPLNFFLQVKNLSIVSVAKIFVPSFDLDITNKDWSQPLPTISININIEQNCQQSRICCQPCFQFWTCEYLKSLMLIAVYSCNPFEDYHRITIHYNISHKMFLEREPEPVFSM